MKIWKERLESIWDAPPKARLKMDWLALESDLRRALKQYVVPATGPQDGAIRYSDGPRKGQIEAVTRLKRA